MRQLIVAGEAGTQYYEYGHLLNLKILYVVSLHWQVYHTSQYYIHDTPLI